MSREREHGFTFVEIMVALAVGVFVIAGMYQAFNTLNKWWRSASIQSDMRQNARAGLEALTRDIEMAGYQTTNYGDTNKTGLAITLAATHEIEMDQQRPENATITAANPVYTPQLVYYHLATDMRTGRQNLYRQIREQPGLPTPDEIVAENVAAFTLGYLDRDNKKFKGPADPGDPADLPNPPYRTGTLYATDTLPADTSPAQYSFGSPPPTVLKKIRRIQVTLTTIPAGATTLAAAAVPGDSTLTVGSTAGFPASGKVVVFLSKGNTVVDQKIVTCTGKDATHFTGCSGLSFDAAQMTADAGAAVARPMPIGTVPKPYTLMASVMPQNLAAASEITGDDIPPATPTGLAVVDNRSCGTKLQVRWSHNTEPDLAGYRVFYGPTGSFNVPVRTVASMTDPEITLNPRDLLITKDADRTATPPKANTYSVRILAYDSSGNRSEKSAAVTGNPSGNVWSFTTSPFANDTTVNPAEPSPPAGFTVTARADEGAIDISWTADASATAGYRLYRSTTPFPSGQHIDGSLQIAGELQVARFGASGTAWTDKDTTSCTTYTYAVASVNCDETLVAGYHYNSSAALSDYAVATGQWQEATPPPAPGLEGSPANPQKALLALTNPTEADLADFDRTEIYWGKGSDTPVLDSATGTVSGTLIPNSDCGTPGTFKDRGSQTILFDGDYDAAAVTYHFLAVSYDFCGNVSAAAAKDVLVPGSSEVCVDDPAGPPPAPTNGTVSSCQAGSVVLGWEYGTVADLAGFRITRTGPGSTVTDLTVKPAAVSTRTWTDDGPLTAGAEYTYKVAATDCVYEQYLVDNVWPYTDPQYTMGNTPKKITLPVVHPGGVRRYANLSGDADHFVTTVSDGMVADEPWTYTHHNNVKFWIENTSRSPVTIKRLAVTWHNSNVVLDSVVIGGYPSATAERTVTVGGGASGAEFGVNAEVAGWTGSPSDIVPVLLRFTTPTGAVNRLTDMRGETLRVSVWGWNQSFPDDDCADPAKFMVDVPRGPELQLFSQSAPGRDGIDSYEVVGPVGTARDDDIKVSTNIGVNVFGVALDNSRDLYPDGVNRGFVPGKFGVFGASVPKASAGALPLMPAGSHVDHSLESFGGDRYTICAACLTSSPDVAKLMPHDGSYVDKVHWYYALAVDTTGNWDRVPSPDYGNYAYYQRSFDVCGSFAPQAPEMRLFDDETATPTGAVVTWKAPVAYDDGTAIASDDVLSYDVYVKCDGDPSWSQVGFDLLATRFDHSADLTSCVNSYMVRAKNSCVAGPLVSPDSNVVSEAVP